MEPVGGYITDTFLPTRRYLLLLIGMISALCIFCTKYMDQPWIMLPGMVLSAGIVYPFSQLMDAWVNISREKQNRIVRAAVYSSGPLASHHKTSNGTDASSNLLLKIQLPSCHPSS